MVGLLMRRPSFRLFSGALIVSIIGDWLLLIALPYFVFQRTHSPLAAGGTFLVITLPRLLFAALSGVVVDLGDRKHVMIAAHAVSAASLLGLFLVAHVPGLLWLVYPVVFIDSSAGQIFYVARNTIVPSLVEREELPEANTVASIIEGVGALAGPPLGGLLLAVAGLDVVILLDIVSFLAAIAFIVPIALPPSPGTERPGRRVSSLSSLVAPIREGAEEIWRQQDLRGIMVVACAIMLSLGTFNSLAVPFASGVLHLDSRGVGALLGAFAVSYLLMAPVVPGITRRFGLDTIFVSGLLLKGAALVAMATVQVTGWELLIFALFGMPDVVLLVSTQSAVQSRVDSALLGRVVSAIWTLMNASLVVGSAGASAGSQALGPPAVLGGAGALLVVVGAGFAAVRRFARAPVVSSAGG